MKATVYMNSIVMTKDFLKEVGINLGKWIKTGKGNKEDLASKKTPFLFLSSPNA